MDKVGDVLNSLVNKSMDNIKVNETDYKVDGILYCGKCRTPKQMKIHILQQDSIVGVCCECRKKELEAERAAEAVKLNISQSGLSGVQKSHTFDTAELNSENQKQVKYCRNYATRFDELYARGKGLLLYGPPSTGKSYLSDCIANELLANGRTVKFTSSIAVVEKFGYFSRDEYESYAFEIVRPDLYILDDFGAERDTAFSLERVHDTIEYRTSSGKPLIVTTNYSLEEMKSATDIRKVRTFERIFACCFPVPFTGISFRKKMANSSYLEIKKILEG